MKPILFNTEMVRALLERRKTVTRRVVKGVSAGWEFVGIEERPYELRIKANGTEYPKDLDWPHAVFSAGDGFCDYPMRKAPYRPGDILYVREAWGKTDCFGLQDGYIYKANDNSILEHTGFTPKWHPSIHMPREAARIFLRVTDVRVERLQNISDTDIEADFGFPSDALEFMNLQQKNVACMALWNSTIKKSDRALYGWDANPWVWVIEFERIKREETEA